MGKPLSLGDLSLLAALCAVHVLGPALRNRWILCTSAIMQRTSDQGAFLLRKLGPFCLRVSAKPNTRSIADSSNPEVQGVTSPVYCFTRWLQTPVTKCLANTGLSTATAMFAFDLTLGPRESKSLKRPGKASFDTLKLVINQRLRIISFPCSHRASCSKIENIFIVVQNDDTAKLCVKAKKHGSSFHEENHIRLSLCSWYAIADYF